MELAVHFRDLSKVQSFNDFSRHLSIFYGQETFKELDCAEWAQPDSLRVYVGDEFCIHRLPTLDQLDTSYQMAKGKNGGFTFLTPPLTDEGMERCSPLFDFLKDRDPDTEVVVNDWGVLFFLKHKFPSFQLSLGRLLNKGFKDPRLLNPKEAFQFSAETAELFNRCTFDSVELRRMMQKLKVTRLERDMLPYGELEIESDSELETSFYFPFGYITTGRLCWLASFTTAAAKKYSLSNRCGRPCNKISLKLKHAQVELQLFQAGNTIFYLYPSSKLIALIKRAKLNNLRLVYQGLIV